MGVFTLHNNPEVDRKIQKELDIICKEILTSVHPISILLAGTFGNGEGSVLIQNSAIIPVADYDLLIITDKNQILSKQEFNDLKTRIMARCHSNEIERHILEGCKIDLFQTTIEEFRSNAHHLSIYNITNSGSIVLYGEDIRPTITIDLVRLTPSACFYSLFRSVTSLLKNYPQSDDGIKKENLFFLIYYCSKIYLHMGTQLTLCQNLYHPSSRKRGKSLKEQYRQCFPELAAANPHLPDKIIYYSELTLFPDNIMKVPIDPVALWFETRQDFEMVMKYCLKTIGYMDSDDWGVLSHQLYDFLRRNYFSYYIEHYLERRHHIRYGAITSFVNIVYQLRNAHTFLKKTNIGIQGLHLYTICPLLKLYAISPLLLFSIHKDGTIEGRYFSAFTEEFSALFPDSRGVRFRNDRENWIAARDLFFQALGKAKTG